MARPNALTATLGRCVARSCQCTGVGVGTRGHWSLGRCGTDHDGAAGKTCDRDRQGRGRDLQLAVVL